MFCLSAVKLEILYYGLVKRFTTLDTIQGGFVMKQEVEKHKTKMLCFKLICKLMTYI